MLTDVANVNSRIRRMWEFTDGNDPTLDVLKSQLEVVYGHDIIGAPVILKREITSDNAVVVQSLIDAYIDSPYSTIRSYKAMVNKGFKNFQTNYSLTNKEVVAFNRIFKSPIWNKIREQYYNVSESVTDGIQEMINADVSTNDILHMLDDFNKSSDMDKSLRNWIDNFLSERV